MNLALAKVNANLRILEITGNPNNIGRLQELGLLLDAEITVVRRSPLAGPLILRIGTAFVVMRTKDAQHIIVEELA